MKVLQLVTRRQFRGAEVFAANLSEQLVASGINVIFAGIYSPPDKALSVSSAVNLDLNGKEKKVFSLSLVQKLAKLIREARPDVIQANGSDTLKYAIAARTWSGVNIPVAYRNISIISAWVGNSFLKRKFYSFLFSRVDYVTSVGEESLSDFIRFFHYPKSKASVIRRGIPIRQGNTTQARESVLKLFNLEETCRLVVHVGSFTQEKNHEFLIEVFDNIRRSSSEVKLVLVGDGRRFRLIKGLIEEKGLVDTVFLAGFREDVDVFLKASELLVLCSKVEGVPGVVLEAAGQGTPALAISVGGVREVIKDEVTGLVLEKFEVDTFACRLKELLADREKLQWLGKNAFCFVKDNFDPKQNAEKFIDLYSQLAGAANGKGCESP